MSQNTSHWFHLSLVPIDHHYITSFLEDLVLLPYLIFEPKQFRFQGGDGFRHVVDLSVSLRDHSLQFGKILLGDGMLMRFRFVSLLVVSQIRL